MTRPVLFLMRIALFLLAVMATAVFCHVLLLKAFLANPGLNALIVGVLGLGVMAAIRQIFRLNPEISWIEAVRSDRRGDIEQPPILLAPMARLLGDNPGTISISPSVMRTLLDSVAARLHESRETSRYLIGLLVFLGLLGTFWGLLHTIGAVGDVVGSLNISGDGDMSQMFAKLKTGLEAPLKGMSTAFSSSLLGLAGSLILGFVDLQASHAQGRFYTELEDWLAETTSVAKNSPVFTGSSDLSSAQMNGMIGQLIENLDQFQRIVRHQEESRRQQDQTLQTLAERLNGLTAQMRVEQDLILKLTHTQVRLEPVLQQLTEAASSGRLGIDDITRQHIRNIDGHIARMNDQSGPGRGEIIQEMRSEIRLLGRTIAALAGDEAPRVSANL
jgi:hypothetical protein